MTDQEAKCVVCGEPMPPGETMFKFHGYSGNCPKPPLKTKTLSDQEIISRLADALRKHTAHYECDDGFYSCELAENHISAYGGKIDRKCTCGADEAQVVLKELGLEKVE